MDCESLRLRFWPELFVVSRVSMNDKSEARNFTESALRYQTLKTEGETSMSSLKFCRALLTVALLLTCALAASHQVIAQTDDSTQASAKSAREDAMGLEVQLHLLVGTKSPIVDEEKLPSSLDAVVKQLRSTFTFKNYRLAATLLNRVKNGGRLSLSWAGGPLLASSAATTATPGFNEFYVSNVKLVKDESGRDTVQMLDFNFGARIPILVPSVASNGSAVPTIQYEKTGIKTDINVREGEPTIVGTLNVGPSGDVLIIVVTAKRPASR
jgi:hypothetical protein